LFERFLNPERRSMRISTSIFVFAAGHKSFNTSKINTAPTRGADRDIRNSQSQSRDPNVGRALGLSFAETDAIAKLIPAPNRGSIIH